MKKQNSKTYDNEFVQNYVTDNLYRTILKELRSNSDGTYKKETGRKRDFQRETLHQYLFYLSMTGEYESSAESAGLPEKRRRKYMIESETFRAVSNLAKNNVSLRARIAVAQSIMGRKPNFLKMTHPATNQPIYFELKEIIPNVNAAMWWLEKVDKIDKPQEQEIPKLGAPRNEDEAKLLEGLLNRHYDYVANQEHEKNKN